MADLTTIEKVRRFIFGNEATLDADEILADLITSSSAWVERQCNRKFGTVTVTEIRDGDGSQRMLLRQSPVSSVTSVTISGTAITARPDVNSAGWVYADGWVELVGNYFSRGTQNVVFVYSAGEAVPADIQQAVIEHVALRYRDRNRTGLGSANGDGGSATFSDAGSLAYINGVLDSYRDLVIT